MLLFCVFQEHTDEVFHVFEEHTDEVCRDSPVSSTLSQITPVTDPILENYSNFTDLIGAMASSSAVLGFVSFPQMIGTIATSSVVFGYARHQQSTLIKALDALSSYTLLLVMPLWLEAVIAPIVMFLPMFEFMTEYSEIPIIQEINQGIDQQEPVEGLDADIPLMMSHDEQATNNDDKWVLGKGSSSKVTLHKYKMLRYDYYSAVAVKQLSADQPKSILIKEANILKKLNNCSAFPQLLGFINHDDTPSIVLEFVGDWYSLTSISLFDALNSVLHHRLPRIARSEWVAATQDVAEGLSVLHSQGYVHTELHNDNVMLCQYPREWNPEYPRIRWLAKIIDLGAAEQIDAPSPPLQLSEDEKAVYRQHLPHQAPELIDGISSATIASDIYAYGQLIDDIGYFCEIKVLCKLAKWCLKKEPRQRTQLKTISARLSRQVARYQNKEKKLWVD